MVLDVDQAQRAPEGPGVLVLFTSFPGESESVVWVEGCDDVRSRAVAMATAPLPQEPRLAIALARRGLRFRAARVPEDWRRKRVLANLQDRLEHTPPPGGT